MTSRIRAIVRGLVQSAPAIATLGAAVWASTSIRAPRVRRGGVAPGEFSLSWAEHHLWQIARCPRPSGSRAAEIVRTYVVGQLTELGFEVDVQTSVGVGTSTPTPYGPRYLGAGRVHNVIARLPGTQPGRAVVLMSHYDSVAQGPGACDAGAPVAALLETARALRQRSPLRNDLLVVLTDGEECGLLGARAFFAEHPWAATARAVLNFEARGTSGPVLMFETGPGNGPVVGELARSGVPAFASSLFYEVYRRLPNATDFSVGKGTGTPGMNFANIGGFVHYHSPSDDIDHVDRGTLQHHGMLALALADRLGRGDIEQLRGTDETFFTVGAGILVRYSTTLTRVFAGAAGALWLFGRRGTGRNALATTARLLSGAAATTVLMSAVGRYSPEFRRGGDFHDADQIFRVLAGIATTGAIGWFGDPESRRLGAETVLAGATAWLTIYLPGGSYLATWPLLGSAVGALLRRRDLPWSKWTGGTVAAVPAALLLAPLAKLLFQALTPRMAGTSMVAWQLVGELAAPALAGLPPRVRRTAALALAVASAAALVRSLRSRHGKPAPETLSYLLDSDSGQAWWLSTDPAPNAWTARALGRKYARGRLEQFFPGWKRDFLSAPAPALPLAEPVLTVVSEKEFEDGRRIEMRVRSARGARQLSLSIPNGDVRRWSVDGREMTCAAAEVGHPGREWELWLHAPGPDGFVIEVDLPKHPVRLRILDRSDGIPAEMRNVLLRDGAEPAGRSTAAALDVESWGNATFTTTWIHL